MAEYAGAIPPFCALPACRVAVETAEFQLRGGVFDEPMRAGLRRSRQQALRVVSAVVYEHSAGKKIRFAGLFSSFVCIFGRIRRCLEPLERGMAHSV